MPLSPQAPQQYHIFLASPGDVAAERQHVRKFVEDYNRHTAHLWNVRFDVIDWENYSQIGVGRPQELITRQTLEKFKSSLALVIGIMAQRFGSPSGKAESGTEEEFNWALEAHKASGTPEIKWFFRKVDTLELPADPDEAEAALDQWRKVRAFRQRMKDLNDPVFSAQYPDAAGFKEVFDRDLNHWLADPSRPWAAERARQIAAGTVSAPVALPPEFDAAAYQQAILKRYDTLNFEMLDTTGAFYSGVRLWSVFVPQSVRECHQYNPRLLEMPKEYQERLLKSGELTAEELEEAERKADQLRQEYFNQPLRAVVAVVDEAFGAKSNRAGKRFVILGDPGSGKTSLVRYLALRWGRVAEATVRDAQSIPLVIELGTYGRWLCGGQKGFVRYLEEASVWHSWPRGLLQELLKQPDRAVLLLDGLDEIFDVQVREAVINDIQRFSSEFPQTSIVVTSRVVGYQAQRLRDADFRHFMLQDLDIKQIQSFVELWHQETFETAEQAAPKQARLLKAIHSSKSIKALAGNPLLLTMMAILNRNQELPRDRADLYSQASRVLLHQWDTERALEDFPGLSKEIGYREKVDILRRVAFHMQSGPGGLKGNLIDGTTLAALIETYLLDELHFQQARDAARTVVEHLRHRTFILCFVGADSYSFVHRTFLEYFCAVEFIHRFNARALDEGDLLKLFDAHCQQDEWHEVLRLVCGELGRIDEQIVGRIVEHLSGRTNLNNWNGISPLLELPLAIECLSEVRNPLRIAASADVLVEKLIRCFCCDGGKELRDFLAQRILPACQCFGGKWPISISISQQASSIGDSIRGWGDLWWPEFVAAVDPDRFVIEQFLSHAKWEFRSSACRALVSKWPDQTTRNLLTRRVIEDNRESPRRVALQSLVSQWPDQATRDLLTRLAVEDNSASTRQVALQSLASKWPDQMTHDYLMRRAVEDNDGPTRAAAIECSVSQWPDQTTRDLLVRRAVEDNDGFTRRAALQSLVSHWPDQTTRDLLIRRALEDDDGRTGRAAIQSLLSKWPDQATRDLLTRLAVGGNSESTRTDALRFLASLWPDQTTRDLLTRRAADDDNKSVRGIAWSLSGKMHSPFGLILPTHDLDGIGPYLDPLQPVFRDHIERAARKCGIRPDEIDAYVSSFNEHLGWDITRGASAS